MNSLSGLGAGVAIAAAELALRGPGTYSEWRRPGTCARWATDYISNF